MRPILLATQSSYKISLFEKLDLPFQTASPKFEEHFETGIEPRALALKLAAGKAESLREDFPEHLIIGADQILAVSSEILGKPGSTDNAVDQLLHLSGKTHELHTAFSLLASPNQTSSEVVTTRITFHSDLNPAFLREMVIKDHSQDCVGGYKYESRGILLMKEVQTNDLNAIIGLPLITLCNHLRSFGYLRHHFQE